MNVTELSRQVRIPTKKLREILPQVGFDIGAKAIKIDEKTANQIIKKLNDPAVRAEVLGEETSGLTRRSDVIQEKIDDEKPKDKKIYIKDTVIVKDLAEDLGVPVTKLVLELMKNGVMASLNQSIDYETAAIIAGDFGFEVKQDEGKDNLDWEKEKKERDEHFADKKENLSSRAPVVVVMGHVDHGKTKLLDAIRETNVVDSEAGGITQHIGAYQVEKNNQGITFIDTPGHEAFSAMRSRGAQVADIAILIVAADDGVQPQTIEAVSHIRSAGLPMIVAINKIDKQDANIDKIKSELAEINLTPEDWGGKTITSEISAKEKINIDGILDTLLLVYEMEKENIQGNSNRGAVGTIIESHVDKGKGPVATCLVQTGMLDIGDTVKIGTGVSKIRALKNWRGENIKQAGPSTPAQIIGLKHVPQVGEILCEIADKKEIKKLNKIAGQQKHRLIQEEPKIVTQNNSEDDKEDMKKVNILLKADVFGSIEAIQESLDKIKHPEVRINVIKKGLGNINEGDVEQAIDLKANLIGFNVKALPKAETLSIVKKTRIKTFNIIYDLLDFVKEKVNEQISPELVMTQLGKLKATHIFKTDKNHQVIGGKVIAGKITPNALVDIIHNDQIVGKGKLTELQCSKEKVNEVVVDQECGMQIDDFNQIQEGDILEFYSEETKEKTI
jgi:translation initiation factor IF-2